VSCDLCERNARSERGTNPFTVVRTETGYVNLGDCQYYEGYTVFVAKRCVNELHELPETERATYLHEMALVAEAVFEAFQPYKLNYELLGNAAPHLHWHVFPRHADDPRQGGTVWEDPEFLRALHADLPLPAERRELLKQRLLVALEESDLRIEQRF
jgi:diadenosine tetraphosphate (Ap4A) HIT family hydrolase